MIGLHIGKVLAVLFVVSVCTQAGLEENSDDVKELNKKRFILDISDMWGEWSPCSVTCGTGTRTRHSKCNMAFCMNFPSQHIACDSGSCPGRVTGIDAWGDWSSCSVTCGHGNMSRQRLCIQPYCSHSTSQYMPCDRGYCPVDGAWGFWSPYSRCSATCGPSNRVRSRHCDNPAPQHGGRSCLGTGTQTCACHTRSCQDVASVNGGWGLWSAFSPCSVTCGDGIKTRNRLCNSPSPQNGGAPCPGSSVGNYFCRLADCKVDGNWTAWSQWGKCSVSCSHGNQTRTRSCTNPAPANGGANCIGSPLESMACDAGTCPVWSSWFHSDCSVTCGQGTTTRLRHCQSGQDSDCPGNAFETNSCQEKHCPVDGQWGDWQAWGACSASCAGGRHIRGRNCSNPAPSYGGGDCQGPHQNEAACNRQACPVWSNWHQVSGCSVTCGDGVMRIKRDCSSGKDSDCKGSPYDERKCSGPAC